MFLAAIQIVGSVTEAAHLIGVACLLASLVLRMLPKPEVAELGHWYKVLYAFVSQAAINTPSASTPAPK